MNKGDGRHRILLAESGAVGGPSADDILTEEGFEVDAVADGPDAVELAGTQDYALILIDLDGPGLDGLEVARRIRRLPQPRCDLPMLALTAGALARDKDRGYAAGLDGFVVKPIGRIQLLEAVIRWLGAFDASAWCPEPESDGPLPLLNRDTLAQLEEDVGPEPLPDILSTFLHETERRVAVLAARAAAGDVQGVADEAHSLKGSAGTFGALALRRCAQHMEQAGRAGDRERIALILAELQPRASETCALLRTYYPFLAL